MKRTQCFIFLITLGVFIWLAAASLQRSHSIEDHGYTKSEIRQHDSLLQHSLKQVAAAETNRDKLGRLFQIEPDGTPVEFYVNNKQRGE